MGAHICPAQKTETNEAVPSSSSSSAAAEETGATGITISKAEGGKDMKIMSFQIQYVYKVHEGRARLTVTVANTEEEFRNTRVKDLKRKLIPEDEYENTILVYECYTLKRNRTLGSYNIQHGSVIRGFRRGEIPIFTGSCGPMSSADHRYEGYFPYDDDGGDDDDDDDPKDISRRESMELVVMMQKPQQN